ncbi:MAG TPA: hypothetical protein VFU21_17450 [Kofleriaceae bacterium]|nr:hypothetical protein [Kofleriaceae bacterium]
MPASPSDGAVVAVHYGRSFGPWGSEAIEVLREGPSTLSLSFNHDGPPEIGLWQHVVDPARFDELVAALRASRYQELPTPASTYPGMAPVSLGERVAGRMPVLRSFAPATPELAGVLACLATVEAELRRHPVRVLRGGSRWRTSELARGALVEVELSLTNAGAQPLERESPHHGGPHGWTGLRLAFLRPNREQVAYVDLPAADVHALAPAAAAPTLALAPGQSASFLLRTRLPPAVRPGRYQPVLEVKSHQDCLWLEPGPLVVIAG